VVSVVPRHPPPPPHTHLSFAPLQRCVSCTGTFRTPATLPSCVSDGFWRTQRTSTASCPYSVVRVALGPRCPHHRFSFSRVARPYHLATADDDGPAVELLDFVMSTPLTLPQLEFIFRQLDDGAFQGRVVWNSVGTNSSLTPPTATPPPAALAYVHSKHIAHCDMSLENVIIRRSDLRLCIIDFGLCVPTDGRGHSAEFATRPPCGKYPYMAPEVRSPRSDSGTTLQH
jgi:hypothetical protein